MTKEQIYEYKKGDFTLPPAFDFNCFIGDYHCKIPKVYKEQLNYARKWIKDNIALRCPQIGSSKLKLVGIIEDPEFLSEKVNENYLHFSLNICHEDGSEVPFFEYLKGLE